MAIQPFKIKEVKKIVSLKPFERWNILKEQHFNTFHVSSDYISFDLVSRGMSSWSHFQKAAFMIGDEAYAGSRNYLQLEERAREVLGLAHIVPTHNGIGAEKLLTTTLISPGQCVLHNRGRCERLVLSQGGECKDITSEKAMAYGAPDAFGSDVDLNQMEACIKEKGADKIAYVHLETCPGLWNGQPISLENIKAVRELCDAHSLILVLDISHVMENAYWIREKSQSSASLIEIARELVELADVLLMDASQDCRSDIGGFIASNNEELFTTFRSQVVVFEGLHTYGGMTGRAMEVFAVGLQEMPQEEYTLSHVSQVESFYRMLKENNIPVFWGANGIALDVERFYPTLQAEQHPKFVLASALYLLGGIRGRIDGLWSDHVSGPGAKTLLLELPKHAYTRNHLQKIVDAITAAYELRGEISGLKLENEPEFVDQAEFVPRRHRLFVSFPEELPANGMFEPYKIAIFEPTMLKDREYRGEAISKAGYNTFLLKSEDVYIDLLTDSGTSAMSCFQWEGMTNSYDTPYSSRHYLNLVDEFHEILGYNYIIPTHQGRAAEHIMSQCMVQKGQIVPGNMYFTTTKLHQEMAGGVFRDVIVDEAHDATSEFPWKGNIDISKLEALISQMGADKIAYISFEMSVNMAGGQPFSMQNVRELSRLCQHHSIPIMFDATRCVENAYMIKRKDPEYRHKSVREILREMLSYGDGCTISCKKDFLVNMGGLLACNSRRLAEKFNRMLRIWEGDVTNGGMDPKDIEALHRGLLDSLDDDYIQMRIEQTQEFGKKLIQAGVPIVMPPGSHAIFIDAKRFLPHIDQDQYPAQALAAAIYLESGVRTMERGNVSKGRNPETGENYRPKLELVRCTIPRRVYTNSHIDFVVERISRLYEKRDRISGLRFEYEPKLLRFFQGRFAPIKPWDL